MERTPMYWRKVKSHSHHLFSTVVRCCYPASMLQLTCRRILLGRLSENPMAGGSTRGSSSRVIGRPSAWIAVVLHLLLGSFHSVHGQAVYYPWNMYYPSTASLSTLWRNDVTGPLLVQVLSTSSPRRAFACGFYRNGAEGGRHTSLLAVFTITAGAYSDGLGNIRYGYSNSGDVIWSANRDRGVGENATLQLTGDGDLVLKDADGTKVWSTNTSGKSILGMNLTESGNLVLFDTANRIVWQSFDHPTDVLVPGQKLQVGHNLTANASALSSKQGPYYLLAERSGLFFYFKSDPPEWYFNQGAKGSLTYAEIKDGTLALFCSYEGYPVQGNKPCTSIGLTHASSPCQYVKLESDGHLRLYDWGQSNATDLTEQILKDCEYPEVCGRYGICSSGVQCSCPHGFEPVDPQQPRLGCNPTTPLSCQDSQLHHFLLLNNTSYFGDAMDPDLSGVDEESCKKACLKNCSCKAAIYVPNDRQNRCYLPSQIYSLISLRDQGTPSLSTLFIKVQIPASPASQLNGSENRKSQTPMILGITVGASVGLFLIVVICIIILRRKRDTADEEEDQLGQVPGMPQRFSLKELTAATNNFCKKLGQGGFGSVFEGTLVDGNRVAVKRLDGMGQGRKEFLAEVQTIGSIHHKNLVRLIGYCAEKSCRLLVYEFMSNGSLDRWIFRQQANPATSLDWQTRCKIILDTAKGLSYLHEDCRQRIAHLDIKPQNILLDENFNAKVSDFGLSKLIDRDQSHVVTIMRGTPGYLAPEWLSSMITEKADVYSFGVVMLEIICGRRNLDRSNPEGSTTLLALLKRTAMDQLLDMVDKDIEDIDCHAEEATMMIRVSAWCLENHHNRRPSMSVVVKVLEGDMDFNPTLEFGFSSSPVECQEGNTSSSAPLSESVLSGPR